MYILCIYFQPTGVLSKFVLNSPNKTPTFWLKLTGGLTYHHECLQYLNSGTIINPVPYTGIIGVLVGAEYAFFCYK